MRHFCLLAALLLPASAAQAACRLERQTVVPITWRHNRVHVPVTINGATGDFVLDTGAADTTLSGAFAARASVGMDRHAGRGYLIGAGGKQSLPLWNGHARMTKVGDIAFPDWEYPVAAGVLPGDYDGLLGADFLHYFDVDLDLQAGSITLWRLFNCRDIHPEWHGDYDAIELKPTKSHFLTMTIWLDNAFLDVLLDSGAGMVLSWDAARRAGASAEALQADQAAKGRGVGGDFAIAGHKFNTLLVGSNRYDNKRIAVDAQPSGNTYGDTYAGRDGLMGLAALNAPRIWISYTTNTLFLQTQAQAQARK